MSRLDCCDPPERRPDIDLETHKLFDQPSSTNRMDPQRLFVPEKLSSRSSVSRHSSVLHSLGIVPESTRHVTVNYMITEEVDATAPQQNELGVLFPSLSPCIWLRTAAHRICARHTTAQESHTEQPVYFGETRLRAPHSYVGPMWSAAYQHDGVAQSLRTGILF